MTIVLVLNVSDLYLYVNRCHSSGLGDSDSCSRLHAEQHFSSMRVVL